MGELGIVLNGVFEDAPILGRVFFASLELLLLVPLLAILTKLRLLRTYRLQSLLWGFVLLNLLSGVFMKAPYDLTLWENPPPAPAAIAAAPSHIYRPDLRGSMTDKSVTPRMASLREVQAGFEVPVGVTPPAVQRSTSPSWLPSVTFIEGLGMAWLVGALLMLGLLLIERWRLACLLARSQKAGSALVAQYARETKALGTRWKPILRVTEDLETPAIVGVLRPVILIPHWLEEEGSTEQWSWTLRHELTHWHHGDTLGQMLRLVTQALFFFHPCVWWAGKRWEEAAELACDRSLLHSERDAVGYAQELCELLGMIGKRQRPLMSTGLFASRSHIGRRIETLLADPMALPGRLRLWQKALAGLVLVGLLGVELHSANAELRTVAPLISVSSQVRASTTAPGDRVLQFPEEYSMGTIYLNGERIEAQGTIQVPAGASVSLNVNEAGAADLSPLARFGPDDLYGINLRGTSVQDEELANLSGLTGLRDIDVEQTPVGDAGMAHLAELVNLEVLCVDGTDAGMAYVENMTNMRDLELNRSQVTDAGLYYIRNLTGITRLDMWMIDITDEGMSYLANLQNLNELGIEDTLITDAGLRYLEGMTNLDGINLENNNITDAGLASLAKIPNLTRISLADTYLTDAGMALLAKFPRLGAAILPVQISPEGLKALEGTNLGSFLAGEYGARHEVTVYVTGEGRPLPDAHFMLVEAMGPGNEEVHVYRTDGTGKAQLYMPDRRAPYQLRAFAAGYVTNEAEWAVPTPSVLRLDLEAASVIGGMVVDTAGNAVSGVSVSVPVLGGHNWDSSEPLPHAVSTDEGGRWTCDVAPKDLSEFWVSLDHPKYATTTYNTADLSVATLQNSTAVLTIADAIGLPGLVVDKSDKPISGVRITEMEEWRQRTQRATGRAATTDREGIFEIRPIRPGETLLKLDASGYASQTVSVNVVAEMEPIRIVMSSPGVLRGKAINKEEEPLVGIEVRATGLGEDGVTLGSWRGTTDSEGKFQWPEAPEGTIHLSFRQGDNNYHSAQLEFTNTSEKEEVFTLPFLKGIEAGKELIDRFNTAHQPDQVGGVAFDFTVEERFDPNEGPRVRRYDVARAGDGRYREALSFGNDGKEKTPWHHSWNGSVYVRHGHPADEDSEKVDLNRYEIDSVEHEAAHLVELDWLLLFVREHSPTLRHKVLTFTGNEVALGDDEKTMMTMRFLDTRSLMVDRLEYFDASGGKVLSIEFGDFFFHRGVSFPLRANVTYSYEAMNGETSFLIHPFSPLDDAEDFTVPRSEKDIVVGHMKTKKLVAVTNSDTTSVAVTKNGDLFANLLKELE